MKTNAYNKEEHIEGYVGSEKSTAEKSDVQKKYEKQNEGNEVTAYGKETSELINGNTLAKDGFDNTGTQGKDSLSDDGFNGVDKNTNVESAESHTGSLSKDFENKPKTESSQRDEDDVLNTGI
ncbi:hypothetical protein [Pedobacter mendelii]|uniref:Uncharacterized protein n=1 Tax=Pedobacter mendelii TaxID=1908240 RepID=A0ABQ2BBB6_9SPHI|nr:hypothetical protein [Pedobacter mendelii]GGI22161.1 hypothetical protein GCM10008119_01260 [Pedobacter mendelii]